MLLDYINSLLELSAFYLVVLFLSCTRSSKRDVFLFSVISFLLAGIFVFVTPSVLIVNIMLFIAGGFLAFGQLRIFQRIIYSSCAILVVILLEFIGYSFLPITLLQTHWGNFIINLAIVSITLALYLFFQKSDVKHSLSDFIDRFWYIVLCLLILSCYLGQLYLSRTTDVWWKLPAIVGITALIAAVLLLSLYIYFDQKQNNMQYELFRKNLMTTESILESCNTEIHNYHSHITHLMNIIETNTDIQLIKAECSGYLQDLQADRMLPESIMAIKQPLFRSTLYGWYTKCQEAGIPFTFSATAMLPVFPLKEYVLVEIMDILFMNALEYEISIPKEARQIDIELKADAVSNEVKISNHITDIAAISAVLYANQGSTTKAGHKGIGLKYARKTCEENQMTLISTIDTENSTLSFSIVYQKDE